MYDRFNFFIILISLAFLFFELNINEYEKAYNENAGFFLEIVKAIILNYLFLETHTRTILKILIASFELKKKARI